MNYQAMGIAFFSQELFYGLTCVFGGNEIGKLFLIMVCQPFFISKTFAACLCFWLVSSYQKVCSCARILQALCE